MNDIEVGAEGGVYVVGGAGGPGGLYRVTGSAAVVAIPLPDEEGATASAVGLAGSTWGLVVQTAAGYFDQVLPDGTVVPLFQTVTQRGGSAFGLDDAGTICWVGLFAPATCRQADGTTETQPFSPSTLTMGGDGAVYYDAAGSNINRWFADTATPLLTVITTPGDQGVSTLEDQGVSTLEDSSIRPTATEMAGIWGQSKNSERFWICRR